MCLNAFWLARASPKLPAGTCSKGDGVRVHRPSPSGLPETCPCPSTFFLASLRAASAPSRPTRALCTRSARTHRAVRIHQPSSSPFTRWASTRHMHCTRMTSRHTLPSEALLGRRASHAARRTSIAKTGRCGSPLRRSLRSARDSARLTPRRAGYRARGSIFFTLLLRPSRTSRGVRPESAR